MTRRSFPDDPKQLLIDWTERVQPVVSAAPSEVPVLTLPWDFESSFPTPLDEAIDAGVIDLSDTTPAGLRSLHQAYSRQAFETLKARDVLFKARRRGIDPRTGKPPETAEAKARPAKAMSDAPQRQVHAFAVLMLTYQDAFGAEAAEAFTNALNARHAGIIVVAKNGKPLGNCPNDDPTTPSVRRYRPRPRRVSTALPVPKPLPAAVSAGRFGHDEDGKPVRPDRDEVRAITEQHAEKLVDLLERLQDAGPAGRSAFEKRYEDGIAAYEEDFGREAAMQLDSHVRNEVQKRHGSNRRR